MPTSAAVQSVVPSARRGLYPTQEGSGRTDALARISNTVFGDNLDSSNYAVGNASVSFPPVWNIWKFDWVQYNASVSQPMARNIGEAMGVGSRYTLVDRYGKPLPPEQRFRSSTLLENLHAIELNLRTLTPPTWPEDVLGAIDREKAARGNSPTSCTPQTFGWLSAEAARASLRSRA